MATLDALMSAANGFKVKMHRSVTVLIAEQLVCHGVVGAVNRRIACKLKELAWVLPDGMCFTDSPSDVFRTVPDACDFRLTELPNENAACPAVAAAY